MKTLCFALTCAFLLAATAARADEPTPFRPATGFTVETRLRIGSSGALGYLNGEAAPVHLGWRGERLALLGGPIFDHVDTPGFATLTIAGGQLRAELTAARVLDGRVEAFVPLEGAASYYHQGDVDSVTWSVGAGLGARYWFVERFGIFAEGLAGFQNTPSITYGSYDNATYVSSAGRSLRANVSSAIGLAYTF